MKPEMFRVKRQDGKYFANTLRHMGYWTTEPLEATRWDRHRTTPEEIVKAFDWILSVEVTAEDAP